MPEISVVMPVFNAESHLRQAIDSILVQSFSDFELLIIDDASTDSSFEICGSYLDKRIRILRNETNLGITRTLNRALGEVKAPYLARMDADDLSRSNRLQTQYDFLRAHPEIGIAGSWFKRFGANSNEIVKSPSDADVTRFDLLFHNCIAHPTVMMRSSFLKRHELKYNEAPQYKHAEDYSFWNQCSQKFQVCNIPSVLLDYREHAGQITKQKTDDQVNAAHRVRSDVLAASGVTFTPAQLAIHNSIGSGQLEYSPEFLSAANVWLQYLRNTYLDNKYYPENVVRHSLGEVWDSICVRSASRVPGVMNIWRSSSLSSKKASVFRAIGLRLLKKTMFSNREHRVS